MFNLFSITQREPEGCVLSLRLRGVSRDFLIFFNFCSITQKRPEDCELSFRLRGVWRDLLRSRASANWVSITYMYNFREMKGVKESALACT